MKTRIHSVHLLALSVLVTMGTLLGGVLNPNGVTAATYYVATTGSNSNSCAAAQNISTPKRNIVGAAGGVSCLASGDTLYIRAGTYAEFLDTQLTSIPSGTSWGTATRIAGYPGETVTLNGGGYAVLNMVGVSYIIFDNLIIDAVNASNYGFNGFQTTHHVRLQNSEVKNAPSNGILSGSNANEFLNLNVHDNGFLDPGPPPCINPPCGAYGFYINGGNDGLIENCNVHHNSRFGIHVYNASPSPSNWIIRNNRLHDNGQQYVGSGLLVGGDSHKVYNNLIYNNQAGIIVGSSGGLTNILVYNNTIYNNTPYEAIQNEGGSTTEFKNNIIYANGTTGGDCGVEFCEFGSSTRSNNLCTTAYAGCSVVADPLFVNAAAGDFQLQAGSPAINAGIATSMVLTDFSNVPRPQGTAYDIGACEYRSGQGQFASPTNLHIVSQ